MITGRYPQESISIHTSYHPLSVRKGVANTSGPGSSTGAVISAYMLLIPGLIALLKSSVCPWKENFINS